MLDRFSLRLAQRLLAGLAEKLVNLGVSANALTVGGFLLGAGAVLAVSLQCYLLAAALVCVNRLLDGLDGMVARLQGPTVLGAFLDIALDFLFYSGVVLGFALAAPGQNALAAAFLLFSFVGTGSTFLAYAVQAERLGLQSLVYPQKGMYYLGGLTEGTETIAFFLLCCFFPKAFPYLAVIFGGLCLLTTATRLTWGVVSLRGKRPVEQDLLEKSGR